MKPLLTESYVLTCAGDVDALKVLNLLKPNMFILLFDNFLFTTFRFAFFTGGLRSIVVCSP